MIQNVQKVTSPLNYQEDFYSGTRNNNFSTPEKGQCLSTFWDEIVKKASISDEFDVETFFRILRDRLNSPEREVRQHALRVLKDFIPIVNPHVLESNINSILTDVLHNLGNSAPSIRKSCVDCLYMYVKYSDDSDSALKNIVFTGMYKDTNNSHLQTNTVAGIIMALPSLILPHISQDTLYYVITALFNKLVQVTYQEVALKALLRTENVLGKERFRSILNICGYDNREKDLDILSEVYGINPDTLQEYEFEKDPFQDSEENEGDDDFDGILSDSVTLREPEEDGVILEAEIQLDTGDAITMKVHEENCTLITSSESEEDGKELNRKGLDTVEEVTDEEKKDSFPRSPRKVRFGGEVIKMRTPDSDGQSSENSSKKNSSSTNIIRSNIPIRIQQYNSFLENLECDSNSNRNSLTEPRKSFIPIRKTNTQDDVVVGTENFKSSKSFSIFPEGNSKYLSTNFEYSTANKSQYVNGHSQDSRNIKNNKNTNKWKYNGAEGNLETEEFTGSSRRYFTNKLTKNDDIQNTSLLNSTTNKFNFIQNNNRSKVHQNSRVPVSFGTNSWKRGHQSASPISLIPIAERQNRSNYSAPEIYYISNQTEESPENIRFCGNNPAPFLEEKHQQSSQLDTFNPEILSCSTSNGSSESILEHNLSKSSPVSLTKSSNQNEATKEEIGEDVATSTEEIYNHQEKPSKTNTIEANAVSPVTSQSTITDISPSVSQISLVDGTTVPNGVSNNLNLSKSDSDLRYSSPREMRASAKSAPSAIKVISFTPLDDESDYSIKPIGAIASSLPDSLDTTIDLHKLSSSPKASIPPRTISSFKNGPSRNRNIISKKLQKQKSVNLTKQNLILTMTQLESKDWETTIKGLKALSLIIKEQPFQLNGHLHSVCVLIGKHIRSLRSQVARCACNASAELFSFPVKGIEMEVDDLATALFHRTADTNKFLRSDAKSALDKMCSHLPPARIISVILNKGVCHHNPLVRCESARLLNHIVQTLGFEKILQLPKGTKDKVLKTAANLLGEGCYETRQHTQKMLLHLSQHKHFWKAIVNTLTATQVRAIGNVIQKRQQS